MRAIVLGGTGFIGRAIVEEFREHSHVVLVVHRGETEPPGENRQRHLHVARDDLSTVTRDIAAFEPAVIVDVTPYTASDAHAVVDATGRDVRPIVLSSMDVYRAYQGFRTGVSTDPVPLDETAPVREERYPYRNEIEGADRYEKLDVEDAYRPRDATVLRLGMVYGEFDHQRREGCVLRRVRAGRQAIPVGPGTLLWSRVYVRDVAGAVRLAAENEDAAGATFNICEARTWPVGAWIAHVIEAAGADLEQVRVPESLLPEDLWITGTFPQHLLGDASKARRVLGFVETEPRTALERSVAWHLAHPPADDTDLTADDVALARSSANGR
jgi:nucleoside-diphosphate-sugar epimerase